MIQFQNAHHSLALTTWIQNTYPLYLQDLTRYDSTLYTLDATGQWQPDYLYWWLEERNGLPLVIFQNDTAIGFVFLNTTPLYRNLKADLKISEFFLANQFRRQGLGRQVMERLAEIYSGVWEVEAIRANLPAVNFWQRFIRERSQLLDQTESEAHYNWLIKIRFPISKTEP